MTTRKLYLVPDFSASTKRVKIAPVIRQLELFSGKILVASISNATNSSFVNLLRQESPKLIIDTRDFPNFFSIFKSTQVALKNFEESNIEYYRISIHADNIIDRWEELTLFKEIINNHFKITLDSILILSSTPSASLEIANKVRDYVSNYEFEITVKDVDLPLNPL
ncbi:MAG: hypothetical protein RBR45_14295 [Pseudomonas sp.]|jgi:hypothetical protein|nr:hypothetical protein [Pseudomonas sp.]